MLILWCHIGKILFLVITYLYFSAEHERKILYEEINSQVISQEYF